jgi:hypothetical protein
MHLAWDVSSIRRWSFLPTCATFPDCLLQMLCIVSSALDPLQREQFDHHALPWKESDSHFPRLGRIFPSATLRAEKNTLKESVEC